MPDLKLNTTGVDLSVFNSESTPSLNTEGVDLSVFESVKKKEEPVSFGGSESLASPSAATVDKQPLTYMQQQLRDKGLIVDAPTTKELKSPPSGSETLKALKSSSARALGGIVGLPNFLNDQLDHFVVKPILKGVGYSDEEADAFVAVVNTTPIQGGISPLQSNQGQQSLNKYAASIESTMKQYEEGIIGSLKNNNYGDAGAQLWKGAVQSLPYLAMTLATSGGGTPAVLSTIGTTAAAQRYGELTDPKSEDGKNLSETGRFINSWAYGGMEAAGELITAGLLNSAKKAIGQIGKEAIDEVGSGFVKQALKSFGLEGSSEGATELGQQVTDYLQGTRENIDLKAVGDAVLVGGVTGAGIGGTTATANKASKMLAGRKVASDEDVAKVNENNSKIVDLLAEKQKAETPEASAIIDTELTNVTKENKDIIEANEKKAEKLAPEEIVKLKDLDDAIDSYDARIESPSETDNQELLKQIKEKLVLDKQKLVEQATTKKQEPVVVEAPKPSKPIEQMSSEEIRSFSDEIRQHEKNIYSNVFGEQADRFKQLEQSSNNPTRTKEQLKAIDAEMQQMIDALPKEKKDIWESEAEYDPADLRDMSRMVGLVEESSDINELTSSLKNPLMTFSKDKNNKQTLAIFNAAIKKAQELGVPTEELIGKTSKLIAKEFKDPQDAMDVVKSALESIAQPSDVEQEPIKAIEPISEPVEPQTKQKGVVVQSETKVAEKQQKEVVVEPTTQNTIELYRGGNKKDSFYFATPSKEYAKEFGNVDKQIIDVGSVLDLTDVEYEKTNGSEIVSNLEKKGVVFTEGEKQIIKKKNLSLDPMFSIINHTPEIANAVSRSGFNSIKQIETNVLDKTGWDFTKAQESYFILEKQQQKQPIVGEQQIDNSQLNLKENGKETSQKADGQGRKEKLLEKNKKADDLLAEGLSDIADLLGTKLSLTGEQRVKVKDAVRKVAKGIVLKGEVKAEQLAIAVKEYFSKAGHDISDDLINEALKEEQDAKAVREQDKGDVGTQKGVVEGTQGKLSLGNNVKDQKTPRGENERQQGVKIISSTTLPEDIKADFEKEGIGYLPRGRKVTREESTQIAQAKLQMEGGREQLKKDILDPTNNIKGDTRIALAVEFVKDAKNTLLKATSQKEIDKARADITEILTYTMNRSTDVAQELEANKMITELLGSDPEFIEDVYRNDINKKNEPFYEAQKENIKSAQEIITEYLNSEEFKNKYKVKPPTKGTEKLTTKQLRDRGINKIANATSKLADLIGAKKNFTQEEMGKGTDLFDILKELGDGLLDVGVASTKELMDKIKANTRKYFKPSEIDQISKVLIEELKAEDRVKAKTPRAISLDAKDEKVLVDRLYSKVINANEKQLKQLLADNVDLLVREGSINDEAFKELFAKAMGKDFVDQKQIDRLKASAQLVQDLKVIEAELEKMFNHAIEAELNGVPKAEIDAIKKQINAKLKEHTEATHNAEKAAKVIGETLAGKGDLAEKIGAVIKGNLITPASQVVNIIGNYSMLPVRSTKNVVATSLDILLSGVGYLNEMAIAKVNAKEIAFINKESERLGVPKDKVHVPIVFAKTKRALAKLPSVRRTRTGFGLSKQRFIGEGKGYVQGIKQLWTGSLPTDLQRVELRAGLHPLDAMINNYNMLTGKDKLEFKKFAENFYEATIGVAPEVTFRLLNLFDKPVRIGAERDKLNQLADLKNLKGMERHKFLEMPDLESADIARKAGDEATFQQDTWLSQWSSKLDQKMLKGAKETTNIMSKAAYYTGYYAKNMVVPFVKTPINVEMELLGYAVPELAVARGLFAMYHGDRQGFTENMGKAIVGSYMLRGIGYLFGAGIMTLASGGHEDDNDEFIAPKIKAAEYRDKPAYYINIDAWQRDIQNKIYGTKLSIEWQEGDQISSYRRMGIVSAMAMAQAEAYRGKSKEEIKAMNFWQTAHTSIPALVKSGAEQTFVSGTSSLINVFIGTEYERDNFFLGLSKAAGASVLPNAVKTYVMANDNLIRETKDATKKGVDAIKNKIITDFKASLTTGSDIPTKITIWGERVARYEDGASPAFQLFDITKTKTYKSDFGAKIFELYEKISADKELSKEIPPKSVLPPVLGSSLKYKDETIKLDPKTYEDMQIYVGTKLKEKTWASLSSMDWDEASDKRKFQKLKQLYVGDKSYRSKLIDRYISTHKDVLDALWLKQYGAK